MHLKTKIKRNQYVGIDAVNAGGLLRLMNHSCNPAVRFHEAKTRTPTSPRLLRLPLTCDDTTAGKPCQAKVNTGP
ncbi:hypothetical protein GQ600_23844 [Phytophthora cactorum]|nr:hypothetical protein GQ600_23844 [Phytophthora cactorum]